MEFLADLGLFFGKAAIVVVAIVLIIGAIARAGRGARGPRGAPRIVARRLNEQYRRMARAVEGALLPSRALRAIEKEDKARRKAERKAVATATSARPRVFVLEFDGNLRATAVDALADEVTAVLAVAKPGDEVVVKLTSPGGMVPGYGLGAAQLERVRAAGVRLTVVVDKVAASGGYLMAAVADHLVAAPFAVIGSIGVVAGIPNLHRFLKKRDVDYELLTAGEFKRTLTVLGENTEAGREKLQGELEQIHDLFKGHVKRLRPAVDLAEVATGEHWYGTQALALGLVDALGTSDDYLVQKVQIADVVGVRRERRRGLAERLGRAAATVVDTTADRVLERLRSDLV